MKKLSIRHWAMIGIGVQFLALIRCLAEIWRLRYTEGPNFSLERALDFVNGGLMAAVFCLIAVLLFFFGKFKWAVAVAVLTVVCLFIYKMAFMR